jgi:C4-type Zn-finger protein
MTSARTTSPTWLLLLLLVMTLTACGGHSTKQQRQAQGEKRTDEATLLLNEAEQALRGLDVESAEPRLAKARELLSHPDVDLSPEAEMCRSQLAQLQAFVPRVREERVKRQNRAIEEKARKELEAAVEKQRDAVVEAMFAVTEALDALEGTGAGATQVTAVRDAIKRTREQLQTGKELEAKDADYAASARNTERRLEQSEARIRVAQRVIDFISGPLTGSQEVPALEKQARREKDLDARLALYTDMRQRFHRCGEEAEKLLTEVPEFVRSTVPVQGRPMTLKAVATRCDMKEKAIQRVVLKLEKAQVKRDKLKAKLEKARAAREKLKAAREAAREKARKAREAAREKALARKKR